MSAGVIAGLLGAGATAQGGEAAGDEPRTLPADERGQLAPGAAPAAPATRTSGKPPVTVTLLTGDRVQVADGGQTATMLPPAGEKSDNAGATSTQFSWNGDRYVIPAEAAPYLGTTLDIRLFNVSYLARAGLDDKHAKTLPLTVRAAPGKAGVLPGVKAGSANAATLAKAEAAGLGRLLAERWRDGEHADGAGEVTLDGVERISLARATGAPELPAAPKRAMPRDRVNLAADTRASDGTAYHTLTVDSFDRDGDPGLIVGFVQNADDLNRGLYFLNSPGQGRTSFSVPAGTYSVSASVFDGPADDLTSKAALVVEPETEVTADTRVTLDARDAVPYNPTVSDPPTAIGGLQRQDLFTFKQTSAAGNGQGVDAFGITGAFTMIAMRLFSNPSTDNALIYATPSRPVAEGTFDSMGITQLNEFLSGGVNTKPAYRLLLPNRGRIPDSLSPAVKGADLTTVHADLYRSPDSPDAGQNFTVQAYLPWTVASLGTGASVAPGKVTEYWYSSLPDDTIWQARQYVYDLGSLNGTRRTVKPGEVVREDWNRAPLVPSATGPYLQTNAVGIFGTPDTLVRNPLHRVCAACRQDDTALLYLTVGDSRSGHELDSTRDSTVDFWRNGKLALTTRSMTLGYAEPDRMDLPMLRGAADYRLRWEYEQHGRVVTDWSFRSATGDPGADLPDTAVCGPDPSRDCSFLPLLFVRHDLPLDLGGAAPAGAPFELRFAVERQQFQPAPQGVEATVQMSYDDGATWSEARSADAQGDGRFATTVQHPAADATNGWASLRIKATDADGNSVEQTVLRAYRLTTS